MSSFYCIVFKRLNSFGYSLGLISAINTNNDNNDNKGEEG